MTSYENFDGYARLTLEPASLEFLKGCVAVPEGMHEPAHHHVTLAFPARSEDWAYLEGQTFQVFVQGAVLGVEAYALLVSLPPFLVRACQTKVPHITWALLGDTPPARSNAMLEDPSSVTIALDEPIEISVYGDFCYFNS